MVYKEFILRFSCLDMLVKQYSANIVREIKNKIFLCSTKPCILCTHYDVQSTHYTVHCKSYIFTVYTVHCSYSYRVKVANWLILWLTISVALSNAFTELQKQYFGLVYYLFIQIRELRWISTVKFAHKSFNENPCIFFPTGAMVGNRIIVHICWLRCSQIG